MFYRVYLLFELMFNDFVSSLFSSYSFYSSLKKWNEIAVFIFDCGFYERRSEFDNDVYVKYHIQTNCWSHCQFEYGEVSKIDAFA